MNKLILVGNGFDLAHGLKTSYNDFMRWYLKKNLKKVEQSGRFSDRLIDISIKNGYQKLSYQNIITIEDLVDRCYEDDSMKQLLDGARIPIGDQLEYDNIFTFHLKSGWLTNLFVKCCASTWVEIENEFYFQLKNILGNKSSSRLKLLSELNDSLAAIIEELILYLSGLQQAPILSAYESILNSMLAPHKVTSASPDVPIKGDEVLVLNFNYTPTMDNYLGTLSHKGQQHIEINYIHGKINDRGNPIVFGFGDELDSDYTRMELEKTNAFFEYIKSFWYFKTSNYQNLIRFLESEAFEVHVWGHSCGLSDRTLLNMIFEHDNCTSIQIYYHGTKEKCNHKNLTQEIARHFRNKSAMRKRIVPLDQSSPMPQWNISI